MEFRLLGPLEVLEAGTVLTPRAPKVRALLAILLLRANDIVSADTLVEDLWSGEPPASSAKVLQTYVSQLRAILGAERIATRNPGYVLCVGDEETDLARFDRLRAAGKPAEALALWRGRPLADFAYEPWAQAEIAALEERRLVTTEERIGVELASGHHAPAVAELEALVAEHPLRERLVGQLVVALYRSGRQSEALEVYRNAKQRLSDELGLEPGPELRRLERGVLRQDPSLDAQALPGQQTAGGVSRFIGRRRELAQLRHLLDGSRLVTVTGPGGVGKTTLAFEAVRERAAVVCVELAAVRDPELVAPAIMHALGLPEAAGSPAEELLAGYLARKELLLVLDNFEQVALAAPLLGRLLASAPQLSLLVTSRAVLHLPGEVRYDLPPLELPADANDLETFGLVDSVALFVNRAGAARPGFAVTPENAQPIGELCARLDGLPLALELAAARMNLLSPAAVVARLGRKLDLLKAGDAAADRHATMRAALDWSYELLDDEERALFSTLSVFSGGFTVDAIEAVTGSDVLDELVALMEASLVRAEGAVADEPRFGMLETIRDYARERLTGRGDSAEVEQRHAAYFAQLAEQGEPGLRGAEQRLWLERLDADRENLRGALLWSEEGGDVGIGLRAAASLWRYWQVRGAAREGRTQVDRLLARAEEADAKAVADARGAAGRLAFSDGDHGVAEPLLEQSVAQLRQLGDPASVALNLTALGLIAQARGDPHGARARVEEALASARSEGDWWTQGLALVAYGDILHAQGELTLSRRVLEEGLRANLEAADARNIARASTQLAGVALETGDAARATRLLEDALALQRDLGDRWGVPRSLQALGLAAQVRNDSEAATANFGQALAMFLDVEDRSGVASTLDCLAELALQAGSHERATRLYAAAGVLHEMVDSSALYHTQPHRDKNIDALSSALGTETYADLWAEGRSLTVNEAVEYANTERLPERSH